MFIMAIQCVPFVMPNHWLEGSLFDDLPSYTLHTELSVRQVGTCIFACRHFQQRGGLHAFKARHLFVAGGRQRAAPLPVCPTSRPRQAHQQHGGASCQAARRPGRGAGLAESRTPSANVPGLMCKCLPW